MKIFLDASVLIAASGSAEGGSRYLFYVAKKDPTWQLLVSAYAIQEARRNVEKKLPHSHETLSELLTASELTVIHPPSTLFVHIAREVLSQKDAPILAAALEAKADFLCTLDIKDFHNQKVKEWCRSFGMRIVVPKDLLVAWRASQT